MIDQTAVPKAELHVHLECSVSPERARALAARNGIVLPDACFTEKGDYRYVDFPDFINLAKIVGSCICSERDYYDITTDYLQRARDSNVLYQELIFWPELPVQNGLAPEAALDAVEAAIADNRDRGGPLTTLQIVMLRHNGVEHCEETARWAAKLQRPLVRAINLAGNEAPFPPAQFGKAFDIARDAGLRLVIHAGEAAGAESVREALTVPGVKRIGHGVRAFTDPDLVAYLIEHEITLETCPGSNVALNFFPDFKSHPFRGLYDAGVKLTLNSDDPPFFWTDIAREYKIAETAFGLDEAGLVGLTRNAIMAGFVTNQERADLLSKLPS
ncbi:adenosine deaminase [Shinella sp. AETb1-6]|uniref:adenosine deaminase n=1 Tax=Shinella sp. AETb1-6 TaxID=2692210 RepID=UPI00136DD5D7|nr:adenosine deaminase [Shinella sp. AETb1-6]MXN53240.1 adenosine deaminase [Shinella sp. AETb1-6]